MDIIDPVTPAAKTIQNPGWQEGSGHLSVAGWVNGTVLVCGGGVIEETTIFATWKELHNHCFRLDNGKMKELTSVKLEIRVKASSVVIGNSLLIFGGYIGKRKTILHGTAK